MKLTRTFLLCTIVTLFFSCGGNRMKNNEKALAKQILTEEEQFSKEAARRAEHEKQIADSIAKLPKGFQFKEDRSVDPKNPPTVIDIAGTRTNPQGIKLSHLFGKVEYIRLEQDPDSMFYLHRFQTIVGANHIYTHSGLGSISQFDRKGKFLKEICKGNLQYSNFKGGMMVTKEQADQFEGAQGVHWNGSKLCYTYENRPASKAYLVTFEDKEESGLSNLQLPGSVEDEIQMKGIGKVLTELKKGPTDYYFPTPFIVGNKTLAYSQPRKPVRKAASFVSVVSTTGDTLCEFEDNDPIINFTKSVSRGADDGDTYYFNGLLHLRQAFNDTIYQLIPPNRLIPIYVLNFGELGIKSANQGVDPNFSLKDKLIAKSLLETNRYLFITYSKDYSCPNTAKKGTLKFSRLIFDKKNETLTPIYLDEAPFIPEGKMAWPSAPNFNIENDLNGMPFYWPTSVTANGKPFSIISGEDLLKLKNQNLPIKNIRKNDRIIAIYH